MGRTPGEKEGRRDRGQDPRRKGGREGQGAGPQEKRGEGETGGRAPGEKGAGRVREAGEMVIKNSATLHFIYFAIGENAKRQEATKIGRGPGLKSMGSGRFKHPVPPPPPHRANTPLVLASKIKTVNISFLTWFFLGHLSTVYRSSEIILVRVALRRTVPDELD